MLVLVHRTTHTPITLPIITIYLLQFRRFRLLIDVLVNVDIYVDIYKYPVDQRKVNDY